MNDRFLLTVLIIVLTFLVIISLNNNVMNFLDQQSKQKHFNPYENCILNCMDDYATVKYERICVNEFCKDFRNVAKNGT